MNVIFATRNPEKTTQIKALFAGSLIQVQSMEEANLVGDAIEDGTTLAENSEKKVQFARLQDTSSWIMADDTGFFINALNGAPGIHAARWAGDVSTEEITTYTLNRMSGEIDRSASFETVAVVLSPAGELYYFSGKCEGELLEAPRCKPQPKMPYSGIFIPKGFDKVWAQMSTEEENGISHRGKAFRTALEFLKTQL